MTQQTDDPFGMSGYRGAALVATFAVVGVVLAVALYRLGPAEALAVSWSSQWATIKFGLLVMVACPVFLFMVRLIARLPRPKSATVFVSYPHEQSTTATTVAERLGQSGLRPRMIAFVERPEQHNEVIGEAASILRSADVLVVVTAAAVLDPLRPARFYEAEIFAATVAKKPVILLAESGTFHLPSTAYEGYPVLDLSSLRAHEYAPLARLVEYAAGTKATVDYAMVAAIQSAILYAFVIGIGVAVVAFVVVPLLLFAVLAVAAVFRGFRGVVEALSSLENVAGIVQVIALAAGVVIGTIARMRTQLRLSRALREGFASRRMTNADLASALNAIDDDSAIVGCLLDPQNGPSVVTTHGS